MRTYSRRASLRESFMEILAKKSLIPKRVNRLKGNLLFRAAVRLVLEYIEWLTEEPVIEEISDDVAINIRMAQQKKVEKKALTIQDRSVLLTRAEDRTSDDRKYIYELFRRFRVYRKYPDRLREILAGVCVYQYLKPGRVIVRQGRKAENLYFILNGEVSLSKIVTDRWTGESEEIDMGTLNPGDIFGEIALLHRIPRSATVVSKTTVDVILIPRMEFDDILRPTLQKEWNVLQDALVHFNYFKSWDEETIRECCIMSRLKDFQPDEVLLGDGKGMVNYVHFLLEGECRLIEHMIVREQRSVYGTHYEIYDAEKAQAKREIASLSKSLEMAAELDDLGYEYGSAKGVDQVPSEDLINFAHLSLSPKPADRKMDFERSSIITTTLLDVCELHSLSLQNKSQMHSSLTCVNTCINCAVYKVYRSDMTSHMKNCAVKLKMNEWHKITDVAEMLMREPSSVSQQCYPSDVRTIFMQISTFTRGACFGLGENMVNRRIVATTPVRCFLVPRYWLNVHNRANIWERVKLFMDSKFPTKEQMFKQFESNRRWLDYKKSLVEDVFRRGRRVHSNVTVHDVPYSIRIANDVGVEI